MLVSIFILLEKFGLIDSMSKSDRRESSSDFLIAQTINIFLGIQGFPSLIRRRTSLKTARNGEIPMPPATKIRFSYLSEHKILNQSLNNTVTLIRLLKHIL